MPKNTAQRRIDSRRQNRATTISGVTLSAPAGVTDHGLLLGLGDDDHTQYLLADGTRTLAGNLAVASGITIDGIDLSAHAADPAAHHALATAGNSGISVSGQAISLAAAAAGAGLGYAAGVLSVGVANTGATGLTVEADAVRLTSYSDRTGSASGVLYASSGNLKLTTQNISSTIGYTSFTSGFAGAGWQVDYGVTEAAKASATFDNLTIRGRMRVYELLIQQIRATNGSVLVSSTGNTAQVIDTDDDPLWTVNGSQLTFNGANATLETTIYTLSTSTTWASVGSVGADTGHYHGFLVGDLIRAQRTAWNGSAFVGIVQSDLEVTGVSDLYTYQGARVSTSSDAPAVGYDFVRIGSASNVNRQGVVYLTSDDDNAPFIDIVDGVAAHSEWNTAGKIKARLGRLDGITDAQFGTLDGYGLWSDNVYLTGSIYATDGIFNGTVYATDGIFNGTVYATDGVFNGTVYATAGTFTGAITAQSGSIDGFLTIGTSGGIYQGTGTAGTPTNGVKWFNDSGIGQLASYDGGTKTFRIGDDDVRYLITTDLDDIRTVKWLDDIDFTGTWTDLSSEPGQYAFMGAYKDSTASRLYISSRVNDTGSPANPRYSLIELVPSRNQSGTVYAGGLTLATFNGTYSYESAALFASMMISVGAVSSTPTFAPSTSSNVQFYVKGGKFILRYQDGATLRYKYLDMTGTGATWTHTTTAP